MTEWKECKLGEICTFVKDRIEVSKLNNATYISTENMLPNRGGIVDAATLPTGELTPSFSASDILVSNIRPYFKKIWFADKEGGCSNDVLCIKGDDYCEQNQSSCLHFDSADLLSVFCPYSALLIFPKKINEVIVYHHRQLQPSLL